MILNNYMSFKNLNNIQANVFSSVENMFHNNSELIEVNRNQKFRNMCVYINTLVYSIF